MRKRSTKNNTISEHGRKLDIMLYLDVGLCEACKNGHLKIVQFLIEQGRKLNTTDFNNALLYACKNGHLEIVQFLVEQGRKLNTTDFNNALLYACKCGHLKTVQYLESIC